MATQTQVPLDVYLRSDEYEPDAEYVDGEIEERSMGEKDHSIWQKAIMLWFFEHEEEWRLQVLPELRVQTSPTRFRIPDVAILDADAPDEQIPTHAPVAAFEVLSPEDRIQRMLRKLGDYEQMGIPAIWIVDPKTGVWSRFEDGQMVRRSEFSLPERGIQFPMSAIATLVR